MILSFGTPLMDRTGLVRFPWRGPGDALPLELVVALDESVRAEDVRAEVWTNASESAAPERFRAVPMRLVAREGARARFALDLPVRRVGNYRAVGRVSVADGPLTWMSESGIADVRFRPRDVRLRSLLIEEVSVAHVNWDPFTKSCGTFRDLLGDADGGRGGAYTLASLAARGVTAVWLLPPFPVHLWPERHPLDELGSPYAVQDYFAVREELGTLEDLRRFVDAAHALGVRVLLDVALNHVGHEHRFRDTFATREGREVRADLTQVAREAQREIVPRKLADAARAPVIEQSAPWLLASRAGDPAGARDADDKAAGGFGEWPDTAQLNHGRVRESYRVWRDLEPLPVHRAVQAWLERVLTFWAVDVGVDGFRLDHLSGLPAAFLEGALNRAQAAAGERTLFVVGEDFHTSNETRHFVDAIQGGFFRDLLQVQRPADLVRVLDDPWFNDVLALSTHDEPRPIVALGDDARAFARLQSLLLLAGGPASMVAGDHLGERAPLPFKRARGIEALRAPSSEQRALGEQLARVGRVRRDLLALRAERRAWLGPAHEHVLAMARHGDDGASVALVVASFAAHETTARFALDDESRARLPAVGTCVLVDALTGEATSCALVDGALSVVLAPHAVRVLVLPG